ncbi:DUF2027 domain-containing protein [Prevotella sp.]|uniref:DUF2027 domain-containing protein n=1 Tax=uncultured Prevotella sp. TaxID=159272 RepID=UPI0025E87A60|nr:DUF2027 domain-containing protein [Prevotella sp.]MCI7119347.1 DUF2027 domain-containing protein [Prevotella sp.]
MKIGDKVQFLSDIGGGKIAGFQGKDIALVEDEDGFQIPTPISDLVVMSSGDEYSSSKSVQKKSGVEDSVESADPDTFNMSVKAKINAFSADAIEDEEEYDAADREITYKAKVEERKGGNVLNLYYAFVPEDVKNFSKSTFACYLINDSNYYVHYLYMSIEGQSFKLRGEGELEPNTKVYIESFALDQLNEIDRVRFQLLSFKRDKDFVAKPVCDVQFRIDKVKFYKLHTFQPSEFFDEPALLYPVVKNDDVAQLKPVEADKLIYVEEDNSNAVKPKKGNLNNVSVNEQAYNKLKGLEKLNTSKHAQSKKSNDDVLVVDLHADKLLETTVGMGTADILNYQLDFFRRTLEENKHNKGRRIVFIHGKGEGVLRHAIVNELRYRYKNYPYQDASFQEYGYGATQVTIR